MDEFRIRSKAGSDIRITQELPKEFSPFKMPGAETTTANCNFGTLAFQHVKGDGWDTWRSRYEAHTDAEISGIANYPIIELHTAKKNHFLYDWDGIIAPSMKALQFNLSYAPFVKNTAWLIGGGIYDTLDFHLSLEMLTDYIDVYPELYDFMELVGKKQPVSLAGECFLTGKMQQMLSDMEEFDCKPGIYIKNMKARIEIFLTLALEVMCAKKPLKKIRMTADLKEKALEAKKILDNRLNNPPSISELARLCTSNSYSIQFAFKQLFSMTIDDYSKEARVTLAKSLLLNTDWDLNAIADATGYYDGASLSRYFKRQAGCTPGEFRKFGRKKT